MNVLQSLLFATCFILLVSASSLNDRRAQIQDEFLLEFENLLLKKDWDAVTKAVEDLSQIDVDATHVQQELALLKEDLTSGDGSEVANDLSQAQKDATQVEGDVRTVVDDLQPALMHVNLHINYSVSKLNPFMDLK
eukprot:270973_1